MSIKDDIRTNLNELMTVKGVKNVELARALGVSKVAVTNWLNGNNSIDIERVPSICKFFGVSIDAFLSHSSSGVPDPRETRLLSLYRMADENGKQAILDAARHSLANGNLQNSQTPDQETR